MHICIWCWHHDPVLAAEDIARPGQCLCCCHRDESQELDVEEKNTRHILSWKNFERALLVQSSYLEFCCVLLLSHPSYSHSLSPIYWLSLFNIWALFIPGLHSHLLPQRVVPPEFSGRLPCFYPVIHSYIKGSNKEPSGLIYCCQPCLMPTLHYWLRLIEGGQ